MKDENKTKKQLINELQKIRHQLTEFEKAEFEVKKTEERLSANKEQYEKLFDSSQDAVMTLEPPTWRFTSGNPAILDMFKVKDEKEFTLLGPWDISPKRQPDGRQSSEKAKEMIQTAMEKGSNFFEWTHKRLTGKNFPTTVLLTKVKLKDKTFLQATVRDITTHKEEHEKLILFKNAVESSFNAIGMATPEGKHWYQNKAFDELFGEVGDNPPETAYVYPKVGHEIFKTIMGGAHWTGEVEIYGKNKQILNIFLRAYSIKDNNGKVIGLVGAHTNITKQKEAEKALQQSKERFRLLANNLPSVMIYQAIVKPDGSREFSYVSENIKYINEVPAEAVLADPNVLYGQVLPEHLPYLIKNENIALKNMATFRHEIKLRLPSGKIRWFQLVSTPHKMPNGNVAWDGVQIDITDQKNVLEALQKQQDFTTNILEGTNAGIWEWNIATGVVTINKRWAEIFGYTIEELSPLSTNTLRENIHPDDLETTNSILQQHIEGKLEYYDAVFRQPHKDGGWIWVNSRGKIVERDEKGKPLRMSGTHIDITERKLVEEKLRESEERFRSIYENLTIGIYRTTPDGQIIMANPAIVKMLGYSSFEDLRKRNLEKNGFEPEYSREKFKRLMQEKEQIIGLEYIWKNKNGKKIYVRESVKVYKDSDGNTLFFEGTVENITEQKKAEQELMKAKNYINNIIDSMPSMLIGVDPDGKVTQWNLQAEKKSGINKEAAAGKLLTDVFPHMTMSLEKIKESIRLRKVTTNPKNRYKIDGAVHYEDITVYPLIANGVEGAVVRVDDVTDQVRLEEMMIQSEKMMSIGGLAAGMAHEINNPLAGIIQNVQVIKNRMNQSLPKNISAAKKCGVDMEALSSYMEDREMYKMMDAVIESGQRASQIVQNMLSFARKSEPYFTANNLCELLDRTLKLAENDYDLKKKFDFKHIELVREYAPDLPLVFCESSKIQQVFLNILKNGAEAMSSGTPEKKKQFILRIKKEANKVRVEIEDNGPGIPNNVRKHVFEPFYTTKPVDKGTGLGLSVSYFIIIENHHGEMTIESELDKGTKLIIKLPLKQGN